MSNSTDIGGDLKAKPSPFPPGARQFVFLPNYLDQDGELVSAWLKWGGKTEFVRDPAQAEKCAICLFRQGALGHREADQVPPFFKRGGTEANVFEFLPQEGIFRRISESLFNTYYTHK